MHGPNFVLAIIAITMTAWVLNNLIRARHGYSISDDWGRNIDRSNPEAERHLRLLTSENERLAGQVGRLEERIAVLERIATDPATRTAREIDALRDR
ncbi:hypothetical protein NS334_14970 [Sphingomonas endophytica]|uniref:Uncharacterized protein n=2 Tax=Sphingomonas endophytica TaxID=869719 RepID=A0A147HWH7_9SPHN|nr:hypothetical protein NS334_14970 [Sphingomonas endophytica]